MKDKFKIGNYLKNLLNIKKMNNNLNQVINLDDFIFLKSERRNTGNYCYFHEARALETWNIYINKITGEKIEIKESNINLSK
jgi:hypothetical protein